MHTFGSLLEAIDADSSNNSSMANRAFGRFVADFVQTHPWVSSEIVVQSMHDYFWMQGDPYAVPWDSPSDIQALMDSLSRPNGFDFTDVATYLLEKRGVYPRYVSYFAETHELVVS